MTFEKRLYNIEKKQDRILKQICCLQGGDTPGETCCVLISLPEGLAGEGSGFYTSGNVLIQAITGFGVQQICNEALSDPTNILRIVTESNLDINGDTYLSGEGQVGVTGTDLGFENWCGTAVIIEEAADPGFGFTLSYAGNSSGIIIDPEIESISNGGVLNGDNTANLAPGTDSAVITFRLPAFNSRPVNQLYYIPNKNISFVSSEEDGTDLIITAVVRPGSDGEGFYVGDTVEVINNTVDEVVVGWNTDLDSDALSVNVDPASSRKLGNGYASTHAVIQFIDTPTANYDVTFSKAGVPKYSVTNQSLQELIINTASIPGTDKSFDELTITTA